MQRSAITLLILGLIVESAGYMIDKADVFSFVARVVSPKYVAAEKAAVRLKDGKVITPNDWGFDVIEHFFKQQALTQYPPEKVNSISILSIEKPERYSWGLGKEGAIFHQPLEVFLSNDQTVEWDMVTLQNELEDLKRSKLTTASVFVFVMGVFLQIVGFIIEHKKKQKIQINN